MESYINTMVFLFNYLDTLLFKLHQLFYLLYCIDDIGHVDYFNAIGSLNCIDCSNLIH